MKYDLFELLNIAIYSDIPIVLVEGKDDPQIYKRIAKTNNKTIDVYPINTIDEYASGCDNVIKAIDKLQPKFEERSENIKRLVGIIDRDVRPYRELYENEIDYKTLKGLFILKYYSIETYFATDNSIAKLIEKLTYLSTDEVTQEIIQIVMNNFNDIKEKLYLISLEALKNACVKDYTSIVGYDDDSVKDNGRFINFVSSVETKKVELLSFASEKDITENDLKLICKGKWFLNHFVNKANEQIKELSTLCRNDDINMCKSCLTGNNHDCHYKYKVGYQTQAIYNDTMEYVDNNECSDILEMITDLIYST